MNPNYCSKTKKSCLRSLIIEVEYRNCNCRERILPLPETMQTKQNKLFFIQIEMWFVFFIHVQSGFPFSTFWVLTQAKTKSKQHPKIRINLEKITKKIPKFFEEFRGFF